MLCTSWVPPITWVASTRGEVPPPASWVVLWLSSARVTACTSLPKPISKQPRAKGISSLSRHHAALFESRCPSCRLGLILSCLVMLWFLACFACLFRSNIERVVPVNLLFQGEGSLSHACFPHLIPPFLLLNLPYYCRRYFHSTFVSAPRLY
ncbi:hypothetical protein F5883DRAFT_537967 [Diaporthe sp. PMI_573]|nr:hypothetical protein F5883DRAFT_537967 [Diaporthaceae sp. PMI_573]